MTTKGALIAAAVAGLFSTAVPVVASGADKGVRCDGGNACKGKSECHSATRSCAGTNACKGKGWISAKDEKECKDKGGTVGK
jgi:hypothetical protein